MDRNKLMQLQQGPEAKPRNYLADMVRDYGLYGLSDRLNSPTSGIGMVVDAVGGLGNALVVQPAQSFNRLLSQGYVSGDPQGAEDAFNVAGAAMLGGIAAPRPRGSIGMSGRPEGAQAKGPRPEPRALIPETEATGASQVLAETKGAVPRATWTGNSPYERADEVADALRQAIPSYPFEVVRSGSAAGNSAYIRTPMGDIRISDHGAHPKPGVFWQGDESSMSPDLFVGLVRDRMNATANNMLQGGPPNQYGSPRPNWMTADEWREIYNRNKVAPIGNLYANGGRPGAAVGAAANAAAERPGIRAYHGSPHDFDRFDMSKIGTGEGAQAYGHGLYFAENEGVAQSYKTKLSPKNSSEAAAQELAESHGRTWSDMGGYERQSYIDEASRLGLNSSRSPNGKMYEVRINANPDEFLDWDKPLSQQSEKVRGAFPSELYDKTGSAAHDEMAARLAPVVPQEADSGWSSVVNTINDKVQRRDLLSQRLREAGIPGIKYLDQGSRSQGEGSRNYVVFDDNLVEILRKYGLLGMIGGGAVAAGAEADRKPQSDWASRMQPGDA